MSILDKSSLVMIPSGYKEDKLYSVKPRNGEGDFTFSRASTGTRVNSDGYIETAEVLSTTELITNGDFSNGSTDWNLPSGVTYNSNGYLDCNNVSSNINQTTSIASGKTYKISFEIKNYTSGTYIRIRINGGVFNTVNINGNGVYTSIITADQSSVFRFYPTTLNGSLDNISVKEVAQNNVPRLDYSGGATSATLLLEPQRTNTILNSEDLSQNTILNNATVTTDQTTSPSNLSDADKVAFGSGSGFFYKQTSISAASTYSVFLKYDDYQYFQLMGTGDVDHYANFDIQNGTVGNVGSQSTASIEVYCNGWYRCILNMTAGTFAGAQRVYKVSSLTAGWASGGGGAGSVFAWGLQVESGTYATSYIPTSGTSVTRVKDECNLTNASSIIGQTEGTIFFDGFFGFQNLEVYSYLQQNGSSGVNNSIFLQRFNNNQIKFDVRLGATQIVNIVGGNFTQGDRMKVAANYKENDFKLYINGSLIGTDNSGTPPTTDNIYIGYYPHSTLPSYLAKDLNKFILFKEVLTDDELEELTTI